MDRQAVDRRGATSGAVGADVGATLAKLALREADGTHRFELMTAQPFDAVARRIAALGVRRLGVTGCGASEVAKRVDCETHRFDEFSAWGEGARRLLADEDATEAGAYLLVSLGTGTSVLFVEGARVTRVGGTALGGGTLLGLGTALAGASGFAELCELAQRGSRSRVDLLISDIYPAGEIALPGEATAAAFGKLRHAARDAIEPADLAASVTALVGENVALICNALAAAHGADRIVFGGTTLRDNPLLTRVLTLVTLAFGREPRLLPQGEFVGALGALDLADSA